LTTTVRVVHRVHDGTTHLRPAAAVTVPPGLAELELLVLQVAHVTDGRAAPLQDLAHLTRGHTKQGVALVLRHQLDARPGGAAHLPATAWSELHVVDGRTGGNRRQRQRVARRNRR